MAVSRPVASPIHASRTSKRAAASKASKVMDKAMVLKATKSMQGITLKPITRSMSSFKVLALASDAHLLRVAKECNVILGSEDWSPIEVLGCFRAKEEAQAMTAEAIARRDLERMCAAEVATAEPVAGAREKAPALGRAISGRAGGRVRGRGRGRGKRQGHDRLAISYN